MTTVPNEKGRAGTLVCGRIPILVADDHAWGAGRVHRLRPGWQVTACGTVRGLCPGSMRHGTAADITCTGCEQWHARHGRRIGSIELLSISPEELCRRLTAGDPDQRSPAHVTNCWAADCEELLGWVVESPPLQWCWRAYARASTTRRYTVAGAIDLPDQTTAEFALHQTMGWLAYLQSPAWQQQRARRLATAGYRCEAQAAYRCGEVENLEVYHRHRRTVGREAPDDLDVLCTRCHLEQEILAVRCRCCGTPVVSGVAEAAAPIERASGAGDAVPLHIDVVDVPVLCDDCHAT